MTDLAHDVGTKYKTLYPTHSSDEENAIRGIASKTSDYPHVEQQIDPRVISGFSAIRREFNPIDDVPAELIEALYDLLIDCDTSPPLAAEHRHRQAHDSACLLKSTE